MLTIRYPLLAALLCFFTAGFAQLQLTDLNTTRLPEDAAVLDFVRLGDRTVFLADSELEGTELYATDGTEAGTRLLRNINPGGVGSNPNSRPWRFNSAVLDGELYFNASGSINFLYKTDGTLSGTDQVQGVPPGYLQGLTAVADRLYFFASGDERLDVHYLDDDGTVAQLTHPDFTDDSFFQAIGEANGHFVFYQSYGGGTRLWTTDGTTAGTLVLRENLSAPNPSAFRNFGPTVAYNDQLIFQIVDNDPSEPGLIYSLITDGTQAGTQVLAIHQNAYSQGFLTGGGGTTCAGLAYWSIYDIYARRQQLYQSDGTQAGTNLVLEETSDFDFFFASDLLCADEQLYFTGPGDMDQTLLKRATLPGFTVEALGQVYPAVGGANYFYERDRIALVKDDAENVFGITAFDDDERVFSVVGDEFSALASDGFYENYLAPLPSGAVVGFRGSVARLTPTSLVPEVIAPINGTASSAVRFNSTAVVDDRYLFFGREDDGEENLYTVGAGGGAEKLVPNGVRAQLFTFTGPDLMAIDGRYPFIANAPDAGREAWGTDGTPAGTERLVDANPGTNDSDVSQFFAWQDHFYFTASNNAGTYRLYRTDGTAAGTEVITQFFAADGNAQLLAGAAGNAEQVLFRTRGTTNFVENLWRYDGTTLTQLRAGFATWELFATDDAVYVSGQVTDPAGQQLGLELYRYPNGAADIELVADIVPGVGSGHPIGFREAGGTVFFTARTDDTGRELWTTDGTAAGTQLLADVYAGNGNFANGFDLVPLGDALYLIGFTPDTGFELFRADANGVTPVTDIFPGETNSNPQGLTAVGDALYFSAATTPSGSELYTSDGTAAGTERLLDLNPGEGSSNPGQIAEVDGRLFFIANDGTSGYEVWRLSEPVSTEERIAVGELSVSPNPTTDAVLIELPEATGLRRLELYDGQGRCLRVQSLPPGQRRVRLSLARYAAGSYGLRVIGAHRTWTGRVLRVE